MRLGPRPCHPLPRTPVAPLLSNFLVWQLGELMESSGRILVAGQGLWGNRAHSFPPGCPKLRANLASVGGRFVSGALGNAGGWGHTSPWGQHPGTWKSVNGQNQNTTHLSRWLWRSHVLRQRVPSQRPSQPLPQSPSFLQGAGPHLPCAVSAGCMPNLQLQREPTDGTDPAFLQLTFQGGGEKRSVSFGEKRQR